MDHITSHAEELSFLIQNSECYQNYTAAKKIVADNPSLENKLSDFKKKLVNMEHNKARGIFPSEEEELMFNHLYAEIMLHKDVRKLLEFEQQTAQLFKNVIDAIFSQARIDLTFLD